MIPKDILTILEKVTSCSTPVFKKPKPLLRNPSGTRSCGLADASVADALPTGSCQNLFGAFETPTAKQNGQTQEPWSKNHNKRERSSFVGARTVSGTFARKKPKETKSEGEPHQQIKLL